MAAHLLHQGVGIKIIGDTLGHCDVESTYIYLRLGVDDLRGVALPAPPSIAHGSAPRLGPARSLPRVRAPRPARDLPKQFHSSLARPAHCNASWTSNEPSRVAIGAKGAILSHWDDFLHRHYPEDRKVRAEMFFGWTQELSPLSVWRQLCVSVKVKEAGKRLIDFITFLEQQNASYITQALALVWAQQPSNVQPAHWAQRLSFVREFARCRSATDPRTQIPLQGLLTDKIWGGIEARLVDVKRTLADQTEEAQRYVFGVPKSWIASLRGQFPKFTPENRPLMSAPI